MSKTPLDIANKVVGILDDKKALDIVLLKTADVTILADYFVICTATSTTHMKTLSDILDYDLKQDCVTTRRREGDKNSDWVLVDCGSVVIHIFLEASRERYKLESLWSGATNIELGRKGNGV